ncbi:MAG: insulinase family protein [Caldilineales bacterium]|nr:insulinase family protein [Caldilineales bacterium]
MSKSFPGPDSIVQATLRNGLRVWAYENFDSQTIVLDGYLPGGAMYESPAQVGLASLSATMLRRGAVGRSFDEINDALESVGASFGFGSGWHVFSLGGRCLVEDFDLQLQLLAESLTQPAFAAEHFQIVQAQTLTGIRERVHNPRSMASLAFREQLYGADRPYGWSLSGYEETVSGFSEQTARTFFEQNARPDGGVIVVVGAIAAADAINRLELALGDWRPNKSISTPQAFLSPQLNGANERVIDTPGKSQTALMLGWPGIARENSDYFAMLVCNTILGRFAMGGRLGASIRKRQGMAYYAYSGFGTNRLGGSWYAAAGVNPDNVTQTVTTIRDEIRRIVQEPISAEELADVQANLSGSQPLGLETNGGIADDLLDMAWYDLGLDYLQTYADRVNAITADDVLHVAQTYLDPDRYVLAIAGPQNA